jgi:hypothetical protein
VIFFALIVVEICRSYCRRFALSAAGLKPVALCAQAAGNHKLKLTGFGQHFVSMK